MAADKVLGWVWRFARWNAVSDRVKVFGVVSAVIGVATLQVMAGQRKKEGHDLMSQEKPAAIRGDKSRNLEQEKQLVLQRSQGEGGKLQ